jgi:hypothetical protein
VDDERLRAPRDVILGNPRTKLSESIDQAHGPGL